jgi:outer membrane protein assembly factor BamB
MTLRQALRAGGLVGVLALAGCQTLSSWIPTIPVPSFEWLTGSHKPGPMPPLEATVNAGINWQASVGAAAFGFTPVAQADAVYVGASDGTIVRLDPATGREAWRSNAGTRLASGVGANTSVVVAGTDQGQVIALGTDGKPAWTVTLSSEIIAPAAVAEGVAVVYAGDGRVYALDTGTGKTKWIFQRQNPALVVRNSGSPTISHGGVFIGSAGGKLSALDVTNGIVGWEATVAVPKGATELERIADVTSAPLIDGRNVCATAFQGRTVCFDALRGTSTWSRDIPSFFGMTQDAKNFYLTDDSGNVQALDKTTGASVWKQDAFTKRRITAPQLIGDYVGVVDAEGFLQILSKTDGRNVGRLATDGSPATAQPIGLGGAMAWQSTKGNVYSVGIR